VVADEQELDYEGVIRITTYVEMKRLLTDLRSIAPHDRVDVIDRQLERLAAAAETAMDHEQDVEVALAADRKGIGAAATLSVPPHDGSGKVTPR